MNGYALIVVLGGVLLAIERLRPGRALPATEGWYARAAALTDRFTAQCGYHPGREQRLAQMLVFRDVNK